MSVSTSDVVAGGKSAVVSEGFPADGSCVVVSPGGGQPSVRGWVIVDRASAAQAGGARDVAVLPVSSGGVAWWGSVRPDQVGMCAEPAPDRVWWPSWAATVDAVFAARAERDSARSDAADARGSAARVHDELVAARNTLTTTQIEFGRRIESMTDAAHEYADDNDLCGVFDGFMESQGLRPRSRDYDIEIDATMVVRVTITRSGRDSDDAQGDFTSTDVEHAVAEKLGTSYVNVDVDGYDVVEVTNA